MRGIKKEEKFSNAAGETATRGLISVFARHPTAANLLMILMVVAGIFSATRITTQFFPEVTIEQISVSVAWPGASAQDIDTGLIVLLEQKLRFLNNVETTYGSAREGHATFYLEYESGTDMQTALGDVEAAVAALNFPKEAETPKIVIRPFRDRVAAVVLSGQVSLPELTVFATDLRDALLAGGLKEVAMTGDYVPEIGVDLHEGALRRYGLSLQDVAAKISAQSVNTPSGEVSSGDKLLRSLGRRESVAEFEALPVLTLPDGGVITLADIATISEHNAKNRVETFRQGNSAIELLVLRGAGGDTLEQIDLMEEIIAKISKGFPDSVSVETYRRRADLVKARIELLLRNGLQGLAIVLFLLVVFLNFRTAFWVAIGIPAALAATFAVMYVSGQTINMISLFALIITLGIVVDDAIVVGEHADTLYATGYTADQAGVLSAHRMFGPILASSLTTILAFMSLVMIGGRFGSFLLAIPLAVSAVLIASLVECFLILPAHMRHALNARKQRHHQEERKSFTGPFRRFRTGFDTGFEAFRVNMFIPFVAMTIRFRYPVLALAVAVMILTVAMVRGGVVPVRFFVAPELNNLVANIEMTGSANRTDTQEALSLLETSFYKTIKEFYNNGTSGYVEDPVRMIILKVGQNLGRGSSSSAVDPDLLGAIFVEFVEEDERSFSLREFTKAWQSNTPEHPRLASFITRVGRAGPSQDDLDIVISGQEPEVLKKAAEDMKYFLSRISGVEAPTDDLPWGKSELQMRITSAGRALGFNEVSLGNQLRQQLDGLTALRFSRDGREIEVQVKLEDSATTLAHLAAFEVRTSSGSYAPLSAIAVIEEQLGFSEILSENGRRKVSVTAELDDKITNAASVSDALEADINSTLTAKYGVQISTEGGLEDERRFGQDALYGALFGIICIYICLAWALGSYVWPLAVLLMIPLGGVGAILGHWVQGYSLSMFSAIGVFGLSGIIINDAIVMLTTIRRRAESEDMTSSIVKGTADRLRAILLTTATTVGGLIPLMFETSIQARFLIPTALTICWGLGIGSLCVLVVLPALLAIFSDMRRMLRSNRRFFTAIMRFRKRKACKA